jgi:hypothetical protein
MRRLEEWFASEETGEAFRHCVSCRLPLLEIDAPWVVNKDYQRGECVLEYAICHPCRDRMSADIPEATKAAIRGFLEREIDWPARFAEFFTAESELIRFERCIACRSPRESLEGFAVSALFDGEGHAVIGSLPLLICRGCYSRMTSLLCDKGRAAWQRFLAEHFDDPGEDDLGIF